MSILINSKKRIFLFESYIKIEGSFEIKRSHSLFFCTISFPGIDKIKDIQEYFKKREVNYTVSKNKISFVEICPSNPTAEELNEKFEAIAASIFLFLSGKKLQAYSLDFQLNENIINLKKN